MSPPSLTNGAFSPQLREARQGQARGEGPASVVRHHRVPDGDGHAIHPLQGRLQQEEQPAEPGHHQVQQPVHGDRGVHQQGRGGWRNPGTGSIIYTYRLLHLITYYHGFSFSHY